MEEVRAEMEAGTDPSDKRVQVLAARWMGLVEEFTGGDPGIEAPWTTSASGREHPRHRYRGDRELGEYVSRALAASDEGR